MKLSDSLLFASLALPILAIPVDVPVVNSPYYNPNLNLDKSDMSTLKPIVGSGGIGKARPLPGAFKDITLKKAITFAWRNSKHIMIGQCYVLEFLTLQQLPLWPKPSSTPTGTLLRTSRLSTWKTSATH
jgi:hypothetical protein